MIASAWVLFAAASLGAEPSPLHKGAQLYDRVVASVEGQVLTESDLRVEWKVYLAQHGYAQALDVAIGPEELQKVLDFLVSQYLIVSEARRLQATSVAEEEVDQELVLFKKLFPTSADYTRFLTVTQIDEGRLRDILRRKKRADRFVDSRIRQRVAADFRLRPGENKDDAAQRLDRASRKALLDWLAERLDQAKVRILYKKGESASP